MRPGSGRASTLDAAEAPTSFSTEHAIGDGPGVFVDAVDVANVVDVVVPVAGNGRHGGELGTGPILALDDEAGLVRRVVRPTEHHVRVIDRWRPSGGAAGATRASSSVMVSVTDDGSSTK